MVRLVAALAAALIERAQPAINEQLQTLLPQDFYEHAFPSRGPFEFSDTYIYKGAASILASSTNQ